MAGGYLVALLLIPFVTGFLCWLGDKFSSQLPRWIALFGMLTTLLITIMLALSLSWDVNIGSNTWVLQYTKPWIPVLGINFSLAMDGLSLLMVGLTALLGVLAVACSWHEIQKNVGFFHLNLLWSLGGVIGVFLAIDMFLFFFFWEMMLVPIYFLIALWGHSGSNGKSRVYAATKFFIYTQASGLIMLVGILALVFIHYNQTDVMSFNYNDLLNTNIPKQYEFALMLCFFIGFAVKLPVVPFHGWLPDAHAQAPTAGSVDLAGILIKTAAYGMIRFVLPFFPNASAEFAPIAISLGLFGIFYGAWLAFKQTDIKRLLAYTSISHMGFILIAIYTGNLTTLQGVMIMMLAHGLSSAALFIMSGELYERLHTRDLSKMGGLWGEYRYLPFFLMFFAIALCGVPGTGNFTGEILILLGAFAQHPIAVAIATLSVVFAGVYALFMVHQVLFGQPSAALHSSPKARQDLDLREKSILLTLVLGILWLGLYPNSFLKISETPMKVASELYLVPRAIPKPVVAPPTEPDIFAGLPVEGVE